MIIDHAKLLAFANRIVTAGGSTPAEAAIVAEHLVEANLRGHDSHGVGMLVAYVRDFEAGTLKANQAPEIVSDTGTISVGTHMPATVRWSRARRWNGRLKRPGSMASR